MTHLHAAAGREHALRGCSHESVCRVPTYELVILVIGLNCWGYYTPVEAQRSAVTHRWEPAGRQRIRFNSNGGQLARQTDEVDQGDDCEVRRAVVASLSTRARKL